MQALQHQQLLLSKDPGVVLVGATEQLPGAQVDALDFQDYTSVIQVRVIFIQET
jgi:hypothetical protein